MIAVPASLPVRLLIQMGSQEPTQVGTFTLTVPTRRSDDPQVQDAQVNPAAMRRGLAAGLREAADAIEAMEDDP